MTLFHNTRVRSIVSKTFVLMLALSVVAQAGIAPVAAGGPSDAGYSESWNLTNSGVTNVKLTSSGNVIAIDIGDTKIYKYDGDNGNQLCSVNYAGSGSYLNVEQQGTKDKAPLAVEDGKIWTIVAEDPYSNNNAYVRVFDTDCNSLGTKQMTGSGFKNTKDIGDIRTNGSYAAAGGSDEIHWMHYDGNSLSEVARDFNHDTARRISKSDNNATVFTCCDATDPGKNDDTNGWEVEGSLGSGPLADGAHAITKMWDRNGVQGNYTYFSAGADGNITNISWNNTLVSGDYAYIDSNPIWVTDISSSTNPSYALGFDQDRKIIAAGNTNGEIHILNTSGDDIQTISYPTANYIIGVDAVTASSDPRVVGVNNNGVIRYYTESSSITSIDLKIDDATEIPSKSSNYDVNATHNDSTTSEVSTDSNTSVSSDDTNIATVDEANTEIDYQSAGTTYINASYTNASGTKLWSNKSVQVYSTPNTTEECNVSNVGGATVVDSNGDIYSMNKSSDELHKIDPSDCSVDWSVTPGQDFTHGKAFAVNPNGIYVRSNLASNNTDWIYMYDKADGSRIDRVHRANQYPTLDGSDNHGTVILANEGNHELIFFDSTPNSLTLAKTLNVNSISGVSVNRVKEAAITDDNRTVFWYASAEQDGYDNDVFHTSLSGGKNWTNKNLSGKDLDIDSIDVRDTASEDQYVVGLQKGDIILGDNTTKNHWQTNATSGSMVDEIAYGNDADVIVAGNTSGHYYFLNAKENGGSIYKSGNFSDSDQIYGAAIDERVAAVGQEDGPIKVFSVGHLEVTSIDLEIDDDTLLPTESTNYDVNGTDGKGNYTEVSGESNTSVASDDTSIASVDEPNTEIDYQGDGTVTVRANYTNVSGTVLWSNKSVETDTPVLSLNLDENPITVTTNESYTVTYDAFGSTTNISSSASVSSNNTSAVSIDEPNLNYTGENLGVANVTAEDTISGETYSVSVDVEVDPPTKNTWANWQYLNQGDRLLVIIGDWTIMWLVACAFLASVAGVKFGQRMAPVVFGAGAAMGWFMDWVPGYAVLSLLIFLIFLGFLYEWQTQTTT